MNTRLAWLLFALLTACASGPAKPELPHEPAIAIVNGVAIPMRRFDEELAKITDRTTEVPQDRLARIAHNILKRLIEEELIVQAAKRAKVVASQSRIDDGFREYRARFEDEAQFQAELVHDGASVEVIRNRIHERLVLEQLIGSSIAVSGDEALDFYAQHERAFIEEATIQASHILFKLSATPTLDELAAVDTRVKAAQAALVAGEDFDALARRMSDDPNPVLDLGTFGTWRMIPELDVVAHMGVGEVSRPVRTGFGFHLVKVHGRQSERQQTFEEVAPQIIASLQNKKFFTARRQLLSDLEAAATIETFMPPEYVVLDAPDSE